jgi:Mg2+-importing ATPase
MLKNITRQLQALLSRHLPRRLTERDPLPNAKNIAGRPFPPA